RDLRPGAPPCGDTTGARERGVIGVPRPRQRPVLPTPEELQVGLAGQGASCVLIREKLYKELELRGELPRGAAVASRCDLPHRAQLLLRYRRGS
ncbi:MAG: hypothetical protein NT045_03130, partial [Candidatus Aureabacteria bacterium]|nr:hypothetical protein [Candidatus Auribacterota bacterium]